VRGVLKAQIHYNKCRWCTNEFHHFIPKRDNQQRTRTQARGWVKKAQPVRYS